MAVDKVSCDPKAQDEMELLSDATWASPESQTSSPKGILAIQWIQEGGGQKSDKGVSLQPYRPKTKGPEPKTEYLATQRSKTRLWGCTRLRMKLERHGGD
jgi:hypothetical protein